MPFLSAMLGVSVVYVSPIGNDRNPGTQAEPVKSLHAAQSLARAGSSARIVLSKGTYYLSHPLHLTAEDSHLSIEAAPGAEVTISGGEPLSPTWKRVSDHWEADVTSGVFDQLWINGRRQRMARYPNAENARNVFDAWDLVHTNNPDPAKDPLAPSRVATWRNPAGGFLHAMHPALWGDMHWLIKGKETDTRLQVEGGWQNNRPGRMHSRYRFVENIKEELDAPGEFFYDAPRGKLLCKPEEGVDLAQAAVSVVRLKQLVKIVGSKQSPVQDVAIRGVRFVQASRTFMENREPLLRSDWTVFRGGAIALEGTENCRIEDCRFDQVGGNTIFVNNWNRGVKVRRCIIQDSGANGIAFVGDPKAVRSPLFSYGQPFSYAALDRTPGPITDNYPKDCLVEDCIITRTGRDEKQTAPVQISMSMGITVRHCSIYDVPRAGINISEGTWGGHTIEGCDVFNTVLETGDHGSFNSWGRDRYWHPDMDVVNREVAADPRLARLDMVRRNVIRGNRWRCDHGWDIDLDDGSSHYLIERNVLLSGGLKLREGFDRIVRNNVILNNSLHPHCWYERSGDVFESNIVFGSYQPAGGMPSSKWGKSVNKNLFGTTAPARDRFRGQGCDTQSLVGDPQFVDAPEGDYRVQQTSPARALGFKNFRMDQFGVRPGHLRKLARVPQLPTDLTGLQETPGPISIQWHGALVRNMAALEFSAYGIARESGGVVIGSVPQGGLFGQIRSGDLIIRIGGTRIHDLAEMSQAILRAGASGGVEITLIREQKELTVKAPHGLEVPRL